MKLIISVKCWKRYDIFELFAQSVKKFGLDVYCSISEDCYEDICRKHGFFYFKMANQLLKNQLNPLFERLRNIDFDYVLELNSNNVMADNFIELYYEAIKKRIDYVGFTDSYFAYKGQLKYWAGYKAGTIKFKYNRDTEPAGHGWMISRKLLEKMNWSLIDDRESWRKIMGLEHTEHIFTLKEKGIMHCGIKNDDNEHKFKDIEGEIIDINLLYNKLPDCETKMIKELWTE